MDFASVLLHPGKCDESYQYCIDVPAKGKDETVDSLSQKFRRDFPHFSNAWMDHISADVQDNFDAYMSANEVGIEDVGSSSTISTYSVGVIIDNFYGMDYLNNKFKVDMKIYIREIEDTTIKTLEQVKEEAYDVNRVSVVEMQGADGHNYHELLTKPWNDVKSQRRYKSATPLRNTFCSNDNHDKMKMISEADYKLKFGSGKKILEICWTFVLDRETANKQVPCLFSDLHVQASSFSTRQRYHHRLLIQMGKYSI